MLLGELGLSAMLSGTPCSLNRRPTRGTPIRWRTAGTPRRPRRDCAPSCRDGSSDPGLCPNLDVEDEADRHLLAVRPGLDRHRLARAPVIQSLVVWLYEGEAQAIRPSRESRRVVARMAPANSTLSQLRACSAKRPVQRRCLPMLGRPTEPHCSQRKRAPATRRLRSPGSLPSIVRLCPQLEQVTSMASSSRARSPKVVWEVARAICS